MSTLVLVNVKAGADSIQRNFRKGLAGIRPMRVQVTSRGIQPVIAQLDDVPFVTAWLPGEIAARDGIQRFGEPQPACDVLVIHMLGKTAGRSPCTIPDAVVPFPMKRAAIEIQAALRDYRGLHIYLRGGGTHKRKPPHPELGWLLRVSWPRSNKNRNRATNCGIRRSAAGRIGAPSILVPANPHVPRKDLNDLMSGDNFYCS